MRNQVLMVVEGELIAEVAEEQARICGGQAVIIPGGVAHRFLNTGREPARTFRLFAPPKYARP